MYLKDVLMKIMSSMRSPLADDEARKHLTELAAAVPDFCRISESEFGVLVHVERVADLNGVRAKLRATSERL